MKYYRYFEYAYLVFAVLFFIESYRSWGQEGSRTYLFLGLGGLAIFMFFFKRRFRKKLEDRNKP